MEKINIAELLKDCPSGMELDCMMYDNLYFDRVDTIGDIICYIKSKDGCLTHITFHENGCYNTISNAKCVIFPKGKTTWDGFQIPFKDGDIVYLDFGYYYKITIFKRQYKDFLYYYALLKDDNVLSINTDHSNICTSYLKEIRLATEEEKQKLFDAIKANGYCWNPETKTLEKLVEPKFKVGDRVKHISAYTSGIVVKVSDKGYHIDYPKGEGVCYISFTLEKDYELAPNKFDITTLKPFDKVLMRSSNAREWVATFYSHYNNNKFYGCGMCCDQCIPYEGNEHLLNTANDCNNFFKVWEES